MIIDASSPAPMSSKSASRRVRARKSWILPAVCAGYLAMVLAVWLVMTRLGDRWWPATVLLLAPRWPYALPMVVLWPLVLPGRRWWCAAWVGVAASVVLFPILGFRLSLPSASGARGEIRLLTCNVHRQHLNARELEAFVRESQPDVVALQGWSETGHEGLFDNSAWHVRREGELLVASRLPIGGVRPIDLSDGASASRGEIGAAAIFELRTPRHSIYLVNLHLASPHAGLGVFSEDGGGKLTDNVDRRRRESELVRAACDHLESRLLLAGDFNTPDDSPIFRECWEDFSDAFAERGSGLGYTYIIRRTQLRIDHILAHPGTQFLRCWVGPEVGSPHRPLVADVKFE